MALDHDGSRSAIATCVVLSVALGIPSLVSACEEGQTSDALGQCTAPPSAPPVAEPTRPLTNEASTSARPTHHTRDGLLASGIALFAGGYIGALVTDGVSGMDTHPVGLTSGHALVYASVLPNWWLSIVPFTAAFAAVDACTICGSDGSGTIAIGILSSAMQIAGAIMFVLGVLGADVPTSVAIGSARLALGAARSPGGVALELTF